MEKKYGQSWIYRTLFPWVSVFFVITFANVLVEASSDICKQQELSSFQFRKLSSSIKSSKHCAELCCKETKCTIPLRVKKHCYGIACAKKELCQVVFEQLKEFQGHRVDKRDADDDDEEPDSNNWEHDHGKALNIYQKRENLSSSIFEQLSERALLVPEEAEFPAFLITRESRDIKKGHYFQGNRNISTINGTSENKFFLSLNDSSQNDVADTLPRLTKRSSSDDDEDGDSDDDSGDVDGDDVDDDDDSQASCAKDSKFHKSAIPKRHKNYHFKKLAKKSTSLSSCSKKCCKTENCVLSFMVEKTCLGVLCSGEGDCHTKRDKLADTSFQISIVKRVATSTEDTTSENDEQKRSTVQSKDDNDDDGDDHGDDGENDDKDSVEDDDDDDVDGQVEDDDEENDKTKKKHRKSKHRKKSKKPVKKLKKSSKRKDRNKTKSQKSKVHNETKRKKSRHHGSDKRKKHHIHKRKMKQEDKKDEESGFGEREATSGQGRRDQEQNRDSNDGQDSFTIERKKEMFNSNSDEERDRKGDGRSEYTDDVKHLIHTKKPMNSTLFDDTVVGAETESNYQDENESLEQEEAGIHRSEIEEDHEKNEEEDQPPKNLEEEKAGRGDESMMMRESSVENDKRSDLMVEHRRYQDVEDRPINREGDEEGEDMRKRHFRKEKYRKHHINREKSYKGKEEYRRYHEKRPKGFEHERFRKKGSYKDVLGREEENSWKTRHFYHERDREQSQNYGRSHSYEMAEDEHSGMGNKAYLNDEEESSGQKEEKYIRYYSHTKGKSKTFKEPKSLSLYHGDGRSIQETHKSYRSKEHSHKKGKKSRGKKKHPKINKEEKLIEKLEHLEEKIEKKQKSELENRKEKILKKVEKLANTLEKKASNKADEKKEKKNKTKKKKKEGKKGSKKSHTKKMKTIKDKGKVLPKVEGSGENAGNGGSEPEKIVLPRKEKHHKSTKNQSSKNDHLIRKKKPKAKKGESHKIEEGSASYHIIHYAETSGEHEKQHHLQGSGGEEQALQHHAEASGGGEDDEGDMAHYLGFERDHKVEDSNWSHRNVIVPYIDKKSHQSFNHKHHHESRMPVLNEDILDGLEKVRYEKKDTIAKPSDSDKEKLKGEVSKIKDYKALLKLKSDNERKSKVSNHSNKKSNSKSKHKKKKKIDKSSTKKNSKNEKLMKEFEKYKAFVKAQEIAMSGDGSGGGGEGSGLKEVSKNKVKGKKSYHNHHDKKSKKERKHGKKEANKKHKSKSKKTTKHKMSFDSNSSGHSEDLGSVAEGSGDGSKDESVDKKKSKHHSSKKKGKHEKTGEKKEPPESKDQVKNDKKLIKSKSSNLSNLNSTNTEKESSISKQDSRSKDKESKTDDNEGKQSKSEPKMFHDRKETSAGEISTRNMTSTVSSKSNEWSKNNSSPSPSPAHAKADLKNGDVISERNTTWHHIRMQGNTTEKGSGEQGSKRAPAAYPTHARTQADAEHTSSNKTSTTSTKRVSTTLKLSTTNKPKTHALVLTTEAPRTTKALKPSKAPKTKEPTTTSKKHAHKTTKPVTAKKKAIVKKKPKKTTVKPTRRVLVTTGVPTLSILTGDEDVEEDNVDIPQSHKVPTKYHQNGQRQGPSNNFNRNRNGNNVKVTSNRNRAQIVLTTSRPVLMQPSPQMQTSYPTASILNNRPISQQLTGPGGSAGVLGDLQLPEPPGNGNRAAGPPFYGQQGIPPRLPVQGPFGEMQYHKQPAGKPPEPAVGLPEIAGQNIDGIQVNPVKPMLPTMKTFSSSVQGDNSLAPQQTNQPQIQSTAPPHPIISAPKKLHGKAPLSPQNVINRILAPHKASPLDVIHNILKPKQAPKVIDKQHENALKPVLNQVTHKNNPKVGNGLKSGMGQKKLQSKPALKVEPTVPHKKPSAVSKKPSDQAIPANKNPKQPKDSLNEFFKKAGSPAIQKTTATPLKVTIPKPNIPHKKVPESSAPINPKGKLDQNSCPVRQNVENMVLSKGRKSGEFTRMPGYPTLDVCIKQCCKTPTCDLLFKSGEVCYLVHCHNHDSCKTEPLKEPTIRTRIVFVKKPEPKAQSGKPAICQGENAFGISWKETRPGNFATRSCPREAKGIAKRQCNVHAQWLSPDFSGCVSDQYTNLNEEVNHLGFTSSVKSVLKTLEEITTQTIDNSLIFGGDILKATNILHEISKYAEKNHAERFGFGALRNFARSASNLLDETNKQEWENVNQSLKGPGKIMRALESFGVITAGKIPPVSNNQPVVTNNMVMSVAHLSKIKKYTFPNYTMELLKKWTTKRDQIILPGYLFNSGPVKVASINYKTLAQLLPHQWSTANKVTFTDGFRVNSKVIATSISPQPAKKIDPPVTVILHHLKEINSARTKCVHWDFNSNSQNGGSWSADGCWVVTSNATVTVCQCEHLTHFAVLMNLSDEDRVSAKEQAKENTFALMWLGIPVLVVLSVGAMYTCFAWSKAPRRRHVVVKDGKPRLPEDEVVVTKTVKEDFPGSPNRYLYSSYTSPSPSDLEWEHVWDFLTNSEFENWQCSEKFKRKRPRRRRLDLRPTRLLRSHKKKLKDNFETSEYFSEGDSSSMRWKHQDDNEWSRERIKCLGKEITDVSSEASQPVDSLEEFSDDASIADSKDGDKCSSSFENFSPDAISSPHSGYSTESKYYSFVYRSNLNLKEREQIHLLFNAHSRLSAARKSFHSSCSSLETLRSLQPSRIHKTKYASTTCLVTIGKRAQTRFVDRKWSSKISLASSMRTVTSSGFLDKTWSSKYASSLSISTLARTVSTKTINDDADGYRSGYENSCCENLSSEQGYGTYESSGTFSADIMDMNITSSDIGLESDTASKAPISSNIPTYDMNLLTPSKKPTGVIEKPLESSSLDNSWMDDFNKDIENFESIFSSSSKTSSKNFMELKEETRAVLKETFIMNMDLLASNTEMRDLGKNTEPIRENAVNMENNEFLCNKIVNKSSFECLPTLSSMEDLGIDVSSFSAENTSFAEEGKTWSMQCNDTEMSSCKETETESELQTSVDSDFCSETVHKSIARPRPMKNRHHVGIINIPRTSNIKKKTKVLRKKSERPASVAASLMTRSPTKHMRSYIVLRQQSRYSEQERHSVVSTVERQDSISGCESKSARRASRVTVRTTLKNNKTLQRGEEKDEKNSCENHFSVTDDAAFKTENDIDMTTKAESDIEEEHGDQQKSTEEAKRISKSTVSLSGVDEVILAEEGEEQIRRTVETSVFGTTLKRWRGRSRLYSLRNLDTDSFKE